MESFIVLLIVAGIVIVPLLLLYFGSRYDWRFRKLDNTNLEKQKLQGQESWRLLGYLLILSAFGISIAPNSALSDTPLWVRVIILIFGVMLIYATSKQTNSQQ